MRKQYLHLCAYSCGICHGPVVSASLAVRENAISKETDVRQVGQFACRAAIGNRTRREQRLSVIFCRWNGTLKMRPTVLVRPPLWWRR
jgi:hypothetical protein